MILMNPAPASEADYKQLRNDWLDKRAADMERRKAIADTAPYKEADPEAVTAYYRIHFKPALARSEDYEKLITRMHASFVQQGKAGIIKARAVESGLMTETWALSGYNLLLKLKTVSIPTLVIYGDHDFIPAATAEHITQAIPNARMVTLKDCGHFTYLECPVVVREQVDAFFAGRKKHAR
jgi:proline iminopeptidase